MASAPARGGSRQNNRRTALCITVIKHPVPCNEGNDDPFLPFNGIRVESPAAGAAIAQFDHQRLSIAAPFITKARRSRWMMLLALQLRVVTECPGGPSTYLRIGCGSDRDSTDDLRGP